MDPETGKINLRRMITAHDIGTIVNPVGHQGQIEGAFVMGMGYGLMAELPSEEGRITTLHLGDYKLPSMPDIPELVTVLLHGDEGPVPFGGQSIAEASNVPTAAAIANAVSDAIGIQLDQLPVSAERVYSAPAGDRPLKRRPLLAALAAFDSRQGPQAGVGRCASASPRDALNKPPGASVLAPKYGPG